MQCVHVFIDGACKGNQQLDDAKRAAGYGVYYEEAMSPNVSVPLPPTDGFKLSNNRAEMMAAIHVLQTIVADRALRERRVMVHTDSNLVLQTVTVWLPTLWRSNDYTSASGKPVANMDLVRRLDSLLLQVGDAVTWCKVEAHCEEPHGLEHTDRRWLDWYGNDQADRLANAACGHIVAGTASKRKRGGARRRPSKRSKQ